MCVRVHRGALGVLRGCAVRVLGRLVINAHMPGRYPAETDQREQRHGRIYTRGRMEGAGGSEGERKGEYLPLLPSHRPPAATLPLPPLTVAAAILQGGLNGRPAALGGCITGEWRAPRPTAQSVFLVPPPPFPPHCLLL